MAITTMIGADRMHLIERAGIDRVRKANGERILRPMQHWCDARLMATIRKLGIGEMPLALPTGTLEESQK